ncbi:MAG: hypothetical protein ACJ72A_14385 [Nocardioidaceae bacterium]|jgi:hypothetical protein
MAAHLNNRPDSDMELSLTVKDSPSIVNEALWGRRDAPASWLGYGVSTMQHGSPDPAS